MHSCSNMQILSNLTNLFDMHNNGNTVVLRTLTSFCLYFGSSSETASEKILTYRRVF